MRVLVATGRPDLGDALTLFLAERSVHVLDVLSDCDELVVQAGRRRPDAVLVDWSLGEEASGRVVAGLMDRDDPTPVIILSTADEQPRALACGAAACATVGDHPDTLFAALREVGAEDAPAGLGG